MRCGYGLIHDTKRHKYNQSEKLNHLYKTKYTNSFDNRLKAPKSYGAITFFRPDSKILSGVTLMIETITLQQTRRST